jgi:predicted ester cyclase
MNPVPLNIAQEGIMADDIKATAHRTLEEIFPSGDAAALARVVHPGFVNHDAPPGSPQGIEGIIGSMRMLGAAFSDRRWEVHQAVREGDTVVLHCTFSGRFTGTFLGMPPTGQPFAYAQVHILRFQDGKAIEHWAVRDDLTFMRQTGAVPAPA